MGALQRIVLLLLIPMLWAVLGGFLWFIAWFAQYWWGSVGSNAEFCIGMFGFFGAILCAACTYEIVERLRE